ncbi:MAG: polysaccharide export protein [Magnetococcales bacterium]|nr:polysaccharide export protein [Magnetococcales bacterium]
MRQPQPDRFRIRLHSCVYFLGCQLVLLLLLIQGSAADDTALRTQYRLGPGDKIQVSVNEEPELSGIHKVEPNGKFSFSFLGDIAVAGLTVKDVEKVLREKLADGYLRKPIVSVTVVDFRLYFINGEVKSPGGFAYQPGLTVRKAVALAGGFTERASEKKITVIRGNDPAHKERAIALDDPVYPDDFLSVPEGFW